MWSGRMLIHIGCTGNSIFLTVRDDPIQFVLIAHVYFCYILYVYSFFILSNFQIVLTDIEQIPYFFHVKLKYG